MDNIQQLLGNTYRMFYHPSWPTDQLCPVQTLPAVIDTVNHWLQSQGRALELWPTAAQDEAARLLWVNWIYQRLEQEPIRKPILVHQDCGRLVVDCGDTRLMALKLHATLTMVPVMITVLASRSDQYTAWTEIHCDTDLISAVGFDHENCQIFYTPADPESEHAVSWFEIGDPSTSHHLHDVSQRLTMMQHYLDQQPTGFVFDQNWAASHIDWTQHQ